MPAVKRPASTRAPHSPRMARHVALLIVGPLLCVVALTSLAFVGLTLQGQRDLQQRANLTTLAARSALLADAGALRVANGQITGALTTNVMTLNNNTVEAQHLRALVGMDTLVAQREQSGLVVVASSLAPAHSRAALSGLGAILSGTVATNACTANGGQGSLHLAGADYVASSAPLYDGAGACIGALVTLTPSAGVSAATLQYTMILAMAGALMVLLTAAIGLSMYTRSAAAVSRPSEQLRGALASLAMVEANWATQMEQRAWVDRRLAAGGHRLQRLMVSLANERIALQEASSDLWAGMSHPGAPIEPAMALRLAREGAVVAARVGSRLNDFDAVTDALLDDLAASQDVDTLLTDALARTEDALAELRRAAGVEQSTSQPMAQPDGVGAWQTDESDRYATNKTVAQRRYTRESPAVASESPLRQSGYQRVTPGESALQRVLRQEQPQQRVGREGRTTGQTPAMGQSHHGRPINPAASGIQRNPGLAGSSGRNRQQGYEPQRQTPRPAPRPTPRPAPRPQQQPFDGRDRDTSGSRWLND